MKKTYHYNRHWIDDADVDSVVATLKSEFLTQGPQVHEFERLLVRHSGAKFARTVSSGTSALHLAYLAIGIGKNDLVLTSPITFVATANAARYCGAAVRLVDICERTFNICPNKLETEFKNLSLQGKRVRAVVAVDFCGTPCEYDSLKEICEKFGATLIQDASQSLGSVYKRRKLANFGASVSTLSFHASKSITTGEGGAVLSHEQNIDEKVSKLRSHGLFRHSVDDQASTPWAVEMVEDGFNYRMSDINAALGVSQMAKLERFIERRNELASIYDESLGHGIRGLKVQGIPPDVKSSRHIFPLLVDFKSFGLTKTKFYFAMREKGINLYSHYMPVHRHKFWRNKINVPACLSEADKFFDQSFSLPLHYGLDGSDAEFVANTIIKELLHV